MIMEYVGKGGSLKLKFAAALAACALAFGVAVSVSDSAFAYDYSQGNWGDESYASFAYASDVSYTDAREKRNDSSSWDACTGGAEHTVEVAAVGITWNVWFVDSPIYPWKAGRSGYLLNNVKERGFPNAILWFNNHNSYNTTLYGVWSPDSI
ncbi:DUF2712 domain-containing protein [Senegalimassilia anaerobia]